MTKKIVFATLVACMLVSVGGLSGTLSGTWEGRMAVDLNPFSFSELSSSFTASYALGSFTGTSSSEFGSIGFIWQGFRIIGMWGGVQIQGDALFGPSTADYLYGQLIVKASIAGLHLGVYTAELTDAVLGGPADGSVIRLAGSIGSVHIVNLFELGARIEDKEFKGITIYHAATGLYKHYTTNPIVYAPDGSSCGGFTGEKIAVSGLSFGCVRDVTMTLHMTYHGFDYLKVSLTEIETGISWLKFDIDLKFELQTKAVVLTPTINLGKSACIDLYAEVLNGSASGTVTGIGIYGLGFTTTLRNVTAKDLIVFDMGKYAITTERYGSVIEKRATAVKEGYTFYPDYWELFSISVTKDGCCGSKYHFLVNTYFVKNTSTLFGWGMTYIKLQIPFSQNFYLNSDFTVSSTGSTKLGFGVKLDW